MNTPSWPRLAALLFGSGFCALIYQVAWMRAFRHIFGASTMASAAVLAIFIGGLGLGGRFLGRWVDRHRRPLQVYANLEFLIALFAAASPLLQAGAREIYTGLGGSATLGFVGATALRLVLALLVLGVPTFLMGGTLPAMARAAERRDDAARRGVAWLYGLNTLGAVLGAFVSTFVLLEILGVRRTVWVACLLNVLVALVARSWARDMDEIPPDAGTMEAPGESRAPKAFVWLAAATVGFAFFLMELVWYRMLGPILGGTVFTFGLILVVALLGVGTGGALYAARRGERHVSLRSFSWTCILEALFLAVPYVLGDRIAVLAILTRSWGVFGFWGLVLGWTVVAAVVILPAAIVAGYQFPLLIALLGRGRQAVGEHVGRAYAWNTLGSIVGSLVGGFGLLPLLSATGCWQLVVGVLLLLGVTASILPVARRGLSWGPVVLALLTVWMTVAAMGPTAAWRHSAVGVGRVAERGLGSPVEVERWLRRQRRSVVWEAEGLEASVALDAEAGLAFVVSGKVDGNLRVDAPTQVVSGLLGAMIHGNPTEAMVIGLGTGSTAGWLAAIPDMKHVDVVELEPAIVEVAEVAASVNQRVLENPKIRLSLGDAREWLLTTRQTYDLVVSEPSNPYRAGIASLFTRDYYEAAKQRLKPGGLFVQWFQAYEVDGTTVRSVFSTLSTTFSHVETWNAETGDLLLIAGNQPFEHDLAELRRLIGTEPYRSALRDCWRTETLEGVLARYVANADFARAIADEDLVSTDDLNVLEFGAARGITVRQRFSENELRKAAVRQGLHRPRVRNGDVDWLRVADEHVLAKASEDQQVPPGSDMTPEQRDRALAIGHILRKQWALGLARWRRQGRAPDGIAELGFLAEAAASVGDPEAETWISRLAELQPLEAQVQQARLRWAQRKDAEALTLLTDAYEKYREDPWPSFFAMHRSLPLARQLASTGAEAALRLYKAMESPFSLHAFNESRLKTLMLVAARVDAPTCARAVELVEPHIFWHREFLEQRAACYRAVNHPRAAAAAEDLRSYLAQDPPAFDVAGPAGN